MATDDGVVPRLVRQAVRASTFLDGYQLIGLKQHITRPTRGYNTLDLLFSQSLRCSRSDVCEEYCGIDN